MTKKVYNIIFKGISLIQVPFLARYETFERVDMGDFNWVTPNFLAFASPQYPASQSKSETRQLEQQQSPNSLIAPAHTIEQVLQSDLPVPFKNVLVHFKIRNIGLVVRLNSELYPAEHFSALGMEHLDMIFPDGTCPSLELVRQFVNLAHEVITVRQQNIAVHCKAGLGRTGCLIGAYLIYRHGFTANEIIAFMRFMRPGMVVGPQQHWLHINQGVFREWWFEDCMRERMGAAQAATASGTVAAASQPPATPSRPAQKLRRNASSQLQLCTPPNNNGNVVNGGGTAKRSALGEIHANDQGHYGNSAINTPMAKTSNTLASTATSTIANDENLPAPTPGQPRKTTRQNTPSHTGGHHHQRVSSLSSYNSHNYNPNPKTPTSTSVSTPTGEADADANVEEAEREPVTLQGRMHRRESETDEEFYLRLLSRRGASSSKTTIGAVDGGAGAAAAAGASARETGMTRRRTSSRTLTNAATTGTQRRRDKEREKRRTASGIVESTVAAAASPVRGSWGVAVNAEGTQSIAAVGDGISGAGGIASWKTRSSATSAVGTVGAGAGGGGGGGGGGGVTGSGVRKTSRRLGSYGSAVWAK